MNFIYSFSYSRRFKDVENLISKEDYKILELCFGDIYIAAFCKEKGIHWQGIDLNNSFVKYACSKGFEAHCYNISEIDKLPESDVCIMMGSLYHFNDNFDIILTKMLKASPRLIISEPVINWSSKEGLIGVIAKKMSHLDKGTSSFRFNEESIIERLNLLCGRLKFSYKIISKKRDILIEITHERN